MKTPITQAKIDAGMYLMKLQLLDAEKQLKGYAEYDGKNLGYAIAGVNSALKAVNQFDALNAVAIAADAVYRGSFSQDDKRKLVEALSALATLRSNQ